MHCNLKIARKTTPRRTILGFNYEAHNSTSLHIQHFCSLLWIRRPRCPLEYGYFGDWWAFNM